MKKIYVSPETVEVRIACQNMIATSLPKIDDEVPGSSVLSPENAFDFEDNSVDFVDNVVE